MRRKNDSGPPVEAALAHWDAEGGGLVAPPPAPVEKTYTACLPTLPAGYEAQVAWGFQDPKGRCSYAFHRVYGPPRAQRGNASIWAGGLDEQRSYWVATWPVLRSGDEQPAACWLSFAEARKRQGRRLSFDQFSSVAHMREQLVGWPTG
jgi:hypothetical protein